MEKVLHTMKASGLLPASVPDDYRFAVDDSYLARARATIDKRFNEGPR